MLPGGLRSGSSSDISPALLDDQRSEGALLFSAFSLLSAVVIPGGGFVGCLGVNFGVDDCLGGEPLGVLVALAIPFSSETAREARPEDVSFVLCFFGSGSLVFESDSSVLGLRFSLSDLNISEICSDEIWWLSIRCSSARSALPCAPTTCRGEAVGWKTFNMLLITWYTRSSPYLFTICSTAFSRSSPESEDFGSSLTLMCSFSGDFSRRWISRCWMGFSFLLSCFEPADTLL